MIEYRAIHKDDIQSVVTFCKEQGYDFPIPFEIAFGAYEEGKLVGLCALKKVYQIEPLINASGHAGVAQILAEKVLACASLLTTEVTALVKKDENASMFERYGFKLRDDDIISIYKEI